MGLSPRTELDKRAERGRTPLSQNLHSLAEEDHQGRVLRELTGCARYFQDRSGPGLVRIGCDSLWCYLGTHGCGRVVGKPFELTQ